MDIEFSVNQPQLFQMRNHPYLSTEKNNIKHTVKTIILWHIGTI